MVTMTARALAILAAALSLAGAGCGSSTKSRTQAPVGQASIAVTSDFAAGATIPRAHTCDGRDLSPPLRVAGLPAGTRELVIVMRDPDAPGGNFVHWAIAHVDPAGARTASLPGGAMPAGTVLGRNSFGTLGYRGPCPPTGSAPHHYHLTVYVLGRPSMLKTGFSADAVAALPALATGSLIGLYGRH